MDDKTYKRLYWQLLCEIKSIGKHFPKCRQYRINKLAKLISEYEHKDINESLKEVKTVLKLKIDE